MKFLQKVKEIRSKAGKLHFQRFAVFETDRLSLYVHKIFRADEDDHLHNHPWNFLTVVLSGGYLVHDGRTMTLHYKLPGYWSHMKRGDYHKIYGMIAVPTTTLFLAYGKRKPWGYSVDGKHVDSVTYRNLKNAGK